MATATKAKSERLNLRLHSSAKSTIERAAAFKGESVNKFVKTSALARAEEIIRSHDSMVLNRQDSESFLEALSRPVQFNDELAAILEEHDKRVVNR